MSFKIGLEQEFFLLNNGKPVVIPPPIPVDECGLLVEARGKPFVDVTDAVYSLMAETDRIKCLINRHPITSAPGYVLIDSPSMKMDRKVEIDAQRIYSKGVISWRNLYGNELPPNKRGIVTAAIHVSFTNEQDIDIGNNLKRTVNKLFDFSYLFRKLDNEFSKEIKDSGRKPGFYEIKSDGRIEYRSLPANVPYRILIDKLTSVLSKFSF